MKTLFVSLFLVFAPLTAIYAVEDSFIHIGKGCTTAYYIDKDCDGYGVSKRNSGNYADIFAPGDMPDADDNDAAVHTGEQGITKWGSMRAFLVHLGYNPNHIYYVSDAGSDSTGVPDDPDHPYAFPTFGCVNWQNSGLGKLLTPGDVVIYRSGTYTSQIGTKILKGTASNPIVFMAYPGEQVFLTSQWGGIGIGSGSCSTSSDYLTFDGFIIGPETYIAGRNSGVGSGCSGCANHIVVKNLEVRNLFWGIIWSNHYFTLENSVFHGNHEHSIYISPFDNYPEIEGIIMRDNIFGVHTAVSGYGNVHNNGHARGTIYEGNIIYGSCGTGLDFQSGSGKDAIIRNNLIFNNGKTAIQISNSGGHLLYDQTNITITNNTLYSPEVSRSVAPYWDACNKPEYANNYGSITLSSETDSNGVNFKIRDIKVTNNILYMGTRQPIYITGNDYLNTLSTLVFKDNLIYHRSSASQDKIAIACSLWHCETQNGSINLTFNLTQLQSTYANATGNIIADPLFTDASSSYSSTPERMDLSLTSSSPAIALDAGADLSTSLPPYIPPPPPPPPATIYGDVSGDGVVNASDVLLLAQHIVGLTTLNSTQTNRGDVSGNGQVTAYDVSLILKKVLGLINTFPVE